MDISDIKQWLKANKKTQQWLADEVRLDVATVNKWLNGRASLSTSSQKLVELIIAPSTTNAPSVPSAALTDEELSTAAQSIGKSPAELVKGVLYSVSDKLATSFEDTPHVK